MKRRWKAPAPDPTPMARQVWAYLWPDEPWPKGWHVEWAGFMRRTLGLCSPHRKRIILSYADAKKPNGVVLRTLAHELLHARLGRTMGRNRNRWHSPEFYEIENRVTARLGLPPRVRGRRLAPVTEQAA